jgi:thiamine pyrophosphate-dependent acetolactate synthase large subunit-like protein
MCLTLPSTSAQPLSQGEIFAAEGYAKTTGRVGVCIATSGPGATNLVTGLADAMMDSVPLVAITGQVCVCVFVVCL